MYQDTITLFNRTGEKWKAIVLPHVDLNADQAAIIAKYGAESKDKASLHVRFTPTASGDSVEGGQLPTVHSEGAERVRRQR